MRSHLLRSMFLRKNAGPIHRSLSLRWCMSKRRELGCLLFAVASSAGDIQTAYGAPRTFCFSGTVTDPGATTLITGGTIDGAFQVADVPVGNNGNATFYPLISAQVSAAAIGTLEWNGTSGSASVSNDVQGSSFVFDEFNFNASLGSPEVGLVLIQTRDNEATIFSSEALPASSVQVSDLEVRHLELAFYADGPWGTTCALQPGPCTATATLTRLDVAQTCSSGGQLNLSVADPGTYPDNTDLTAAFPGVVLSLESPVIAGFVTNSTEPGSGVSFFIQRFDAGSLDDTWTDDPGFPRYFRADFSSPVNFVSIEMYKSHVCDQNPGAVCSGVLEAYDSGGALVETVTTGALTGYWSDPPVVAEIRRNTADIAHIRAYGTGGSASSSGGIVLSRMQYGVVQSSGSDVDRDGIPDLQDPCPADPENACDIAGSAAADVSANTGGSVTTPDGSVSLGIEPGDLEADATLSVTETAPDDPDVDIALATGTSLGTALSVYNLEPDGLQFASPITLTIVADVTSLDEVQRTNMDIYRFEDTDADLVPDTYVPLNADCSILEDPIGTFTATCGVMLEHFSTYALIVPQDSDGDGVPDNFNGQSDNCSDEDATGFDVDNDGCIDSFNGLTDLVSRLVAEQVISATMENSLLSKVANAQKSSQKESLCAAINELEAFKNQVMAQTGNKISLEAATLVLSYTDSLVRLLQKKLPSGSAC